MCSSDLGSGIYAALRGRMAIFNEWVREISDRHGTVLVDMWRMRDGDHAEVFDTDRMHLNSYGHQYIAFAVLDALGIAHEVAQLPRPRLPDLGARERLAANATWTREFLGPWIHRRLTGRSSGDSIEVKRPDLSPIDPS